MITRIGDKIISITKVPDLRNYRGDRVLGLSCTSGRFGYIKLLSDLELPEFWDYISGRCDDSLCSIQKRKVMELLGLTKEILGSIITTPARASEFLLRHEISHILHHDSDDIRLSESSHLDPYRIGIEARATWEAWKQMKNKYMAKFRVQRRLFAGTADVISTAQGLATGNNGRAKSGYGQLNKTLNTQVGNYTDAKKNYFEGYDKWAKEGNTGGRAAFNQTTEGSKLWGEATAGRASVKNTANKIAEKATGITTGNGVAVGSNQSAINQIANKEGLAKVNQSVGRSQATIMDGLKNTWAKSGTLGKAGMVGVGVLGTGLALKGAASLLGGGDKKQNEFSDTKQDLREATLIGTGLAAAGTGVYLAKKGKLGITKKHKEATKKAYDKAVAKIKGWYKETERGGNKIQQEATNTNTVSGASEAGKKPFYSKENKKAAEEYAKKHGITWQEAAKKLGFKPESYK